MSRRHQGQDAAGAFDGLINGKWGFHTLREKDSWWCVDLGESLPRDVSHRTVPPSLSAATQGALL